MQHLAISSRQAQMKTPQDPSSSLVLSEISMEDDDTQIFSISVLEWLNAELRKEAEKQEIVALRTNVNVMDRLQNMISSNGTGITIMIVGFFLM